jgi:RNA polymerase sigma-70 factor (ECF subfamily)
VSVTPLCLGDETIEETERLTDEFVTAALATADHYARKTARTLRLPAAEIDDLRQELLMEVLVRSARFDARRAAWITFVDLVVRHEAHALASRLRQACRLHNRSIEDPVPLSEGRKARLAEVMPDTEGIAALWSPPFDPFAAAELRIDIERFVADLPDRLRRLCRLLQTEDIADALRLSGLSTAQFYRELRELRMRLRALGLGRPGGPP